MDTNNQNEQQAQMQATEAYPLEDRSLCAEETLTAQRSDFADGDTYVPTFIP